MNKKKICEILLIIIGILLIIVSILIVNKYRKNVKNYKEAIVWIENFYMEEPNQVDDVKTLKYKGYDVIGVIKIPKIELQYPIISENSKEAMDVSITKFFGNGVNEVGNLTLAGHNNYDNTMFGKLNELKIYDIIQLTDINKNTKEYKIYKIFKTTPNDSSVVSTEEFGTREVTLITCSNGNKERLIVKAREIQ